MRSRATTRRLFGALVATMLLSVAGGGVAVAQSPFDDVEPEAVAPSIRVSAVEINEGTVTLEVEVPPNIAGSRLDPSAVSVIIDGDYRLAEVRRPPADDLAVMLAIDISGSTEGPPLEAAKAAAIAFLDRLPEGTLVGLISFGTEARVISPPTADLQVLREGIASLTADGRTALFDAVALSAQTLSQSSASRRIVVVFSDGTDTQSTVSLVSARDLVEAADLRVEVVSLSTELTDPVALALLAGPDGSVLAVDDPDGLAAVFSELGDGLGNQFIVTIPDVASNEIVIVVRGDDGVARGQFVIDTGVADLTPGAVEVPTTPLTIAPPRAAPSVVVSAPQIATDPETMFGDRTFLYGVGGVLVGLLAAGVLAAWPNPDATKTRRRPQKPALQKKRSARDAANRLTAFADAGMSRRGKKSKTARMLEEAGSALRPGEFIVIVAALTLAAVTIATVTTGPIMGVSAAVATIIASRVWLHRKIKSVRAAFADQLGATLQLLASNLRVGHGLLQGVDAIARESEQPTAQEFQRVIGEVRLGRDVGEALRAMAERLDNEDFRWVVQAIEIHREVGGDLGEVLDNVGSTIRDRMRLKGQIHSLSADGRISAAVMMALPFCVAGLMLATTPDYLDELTGRTGGQMLLGVGALLMVAGAAWLKSIIRLQF